MVDHQLPSTVSDHKLVSTAYEETWNRKQKKSIEDSLKSRNLVNFCRVSYDFNCLPYDYKASSFKADGLSCNWPKSVNFLSLSAEADSKTLKLN